METERNHAKNQYPESSPKFSTTKKIDIFSRRLFSFFLYYIPTYICIYIF